MKVSLFPLMAVIGLSIATPVAFAVDEDLGEAPGSTHGTINNPGKSIHTYRKQWGDDSGDLKYMHEFDKAHVLKSPEACEAYRKIRLKHHPHNNMFCGKVTPHRWILWGDDYDRPVRWSKTDPAIFTR